jgi:ABC-type Fe3+/spermidine/putrescine transport system ATPase subunit
MMSEAGLVLSGLTKRFEHHEAVRDLSLTVPQGSVLVLLGPSGSGKTTTLRLIAGFEKPDEGTVVVAGRDVTNLAPAQRRFGMVFQQYALFPHLDVAGNVGFGLSDLRVEERKRRVAEALALVDLAGFEARQVTELSGGQQQRVAVARAVAPRPAVLLFDEPLSNLDPSLRERTRRELREAIDRIGVTTVFVTHEQEEAFALGDVVAVLRDGALEQMAPAPELYDKPLTPFVATFVGRASALWGVMVDAHRARVAPGVEWTVTSSRPLAPETRVLLAVRPEVVKLVREGGMEGVVRECRYTGARAYFEVESAAGIVEFEASVHEASVGDRVHLTAETAFAFPEETR